MSGRAMLVIACVVLASVWAACSPALPAEPIAAPRTPLPSRVAGTTATPPPTRTAAPPTATPRRVQRIFTQSDIDPFVALYATERDGLFVTSRNALARYYYKWDDRRWFALEERVWFHALEDLLTVFPNRVPAP